MSDVSDTVSGARQLADSGQWGKTRDQLASEWSPESKGWARSAFERAAKTAWLLVQKRPSTSRFRFTNGPIGDTLDFVQWTDGNVHQLLIEQGALFGDPGSVEAVKKAADGGDERAKALLAFINKK